MKIHLVDGTYELFRYYLLPYPIVLGKGESFFANGVAASLKLTESKPMRSGVALFRYKPD